MISLRPLPLSRCFSVIKRLQSTARKGQTAMGLFDHVESVAGKPKSKPLPALDAFLAVEEISSDEEDFSSAPHPQQAKPPSSSVSRAQQPRSVPQKRSYFDPKPDSRAKSATAVPTAFVLGGSISIAQPSALRGSSKSNAVKQSGAFKPYKKSESSTKVQVHLPLYSYRDKRFSDPSPIPKRVYIRNVDQANELVEKLDTSGALGFDLEWRVLFRSKAPPRPTAVLQICDKSNILVVQLSAMNGQFPSKLRAILEDRTVPKLGVNILNDGIRLGNDFGFRAHCLLELGGLARQADSGPRGYIERYFAVTNPDYLDEYLASLEETQADTYSEKEKEKIPREKENGFPMFAEDEILAPEKKESAVPSNKPRKPGAMIALATVTAMYTGRTLDKGPVRSSNWEKEPLTEQQLDYAANDAHCALVIYERLMRLARSNNVTLDPERYTQDVKWYHIKKKPEHTSIQKLTPIANVAHRSSSMPSTSSSSTMTVKTSSTSDGYLPLYADNDAPSSSSSAPWTNSGKDNVPVPTEPDIQMHTDQPSAARHTAPRVVKQRPQHIRSYNLWYGMSMPLDEMCKTLRSPDNPLKIGTVISYVVGALQADPSLSFSYEKIKLLLQSEKASFERHRLWFEALSRTDNIHRNMTRRDSRNDFMKY